MDPQHGFQINLNSEVQYRINDQFQFLSRARLPAKCQIVVTFQQLFALDKKYLAVLFFTLNLSNKRNKREVVPQVEAPLGHYRFYQYLSLSGFVHCTGS